MVPWPAAAAAALLRGRRRAGARLLDAGCGTGGNLAAFGPGRGVDPAPEAVAACRARGLDVVQARLEALPFDDGAFDLVLATDVLEHVDDDVAALRELRRVAAPGAVLLVTVPAHPRLWSAHDVALHHRRRYRRAELLARLRAAGWDPVVVTWWNASSSRSSRSPGCAAARGHRPRPDARVGRPPARATAGRRGLARRPRGAAAVGVSLAVAAKPDAQP